VIFIKVISFIYTEKNEIILEEIYKIIEKKEIDIAEAKKLQPNTKENEQLTLIINSPDYKELSQKEKELIWKYRYLFQITKILFERSEERRID